MTSGTSQNLYGIGSFGGQPSELAKLATLIAVAAWLSRKDDRREISTRRSVQAAGIALLALIDHTGSFPFGSERLPQLVHRAAALMPDLALQFIARCLLVLLPFRLTLLKLGAQLFRRLFTLPGLVHRGLDGGPSLFDHAQHRPIEKVLENPHQNQEVDDFQGDGCPVQFHALNLPCSSGVISAAGVRAGDCGTAR